MVLIDEEKGVLTSHNNLLTNPRYQVKTVTKPAVMADILRVHDYRYIKNVIQRCKAIELADEPLGRYDRDSTLSPESWQAALLSSGSIIEAIDFVMSGKFKNGFCAVRPPGHHAGVFGKTFKNNVCDQEQTNGFCYINNVAVAAAYLRNVYRHKI